MSEFLKIKDACVVTGLSMYYLRKGCKDGSIPHLKSGETYYIDMQAFRDHLREMSKTQIAQAKS